MFLVVKISCLGKAFKVSDTGTSEKAEEITVSLFCGFCGGFFLAYDADVDSRVGTWKSEHIFTEKAAFVYDMAVILTAYNTRNGNSDLAVRGASEFSLTAAAGTFEFEQISGQCENPDDAENHFAACGAAVSEGGFCGIKYHYSKSFRKKIRIPKILYSDRESPVRNVLPGSIQSCFCK